MIWKAKLMTHKGEARIAIYFEINAENLYCVKHFIDSKWSQKRKVWHLPDTEENRRRFDLTSASSTLPSFEGINAIEKFRRWLFSKRYSENTIKTYTDALRSFLVFYRHISITEITNEHVIHYNNEFILENKLSASYQNQIVNALKLFFLVVTEKSIDPQLIHRPKVSKLLPNVLSKQEVKEILNSSINLKHRTMLSLIYACGLRCSEVLNLQFSDIQTERGLLMIRNSKGKKDRIVPISLKVIEMLRDYYKIYRPTKWLFEGQIVGEPYKARSLQSALHRSVDKTAIKKPVTLHWLRHSYATHLLETGTDLRYIQELLGHSSSRTTEIYTHVSTKNIQNIRSPFDEL